MLLYIYPELLSPCCLAHLPRSQTAPPRSLQDLLERQWEQTAQFILDKVGKQNNGESSYAVVPGCCKSLSFPCSYKLILVSVQCTEQYCTYMYVGCYLAENCVFILLARVYTVEYIMFTLQTSHKHAHTHTHTHTHSGLHACTPPHPPIREQTDAVQDHGASLAERILHCHKHQATSDPLRTRHHQPTTQRHPRRASASAP